MNAATEHVRAGLEVERLTKATAQNEETARNIEQEIAAQQAAVTQNEATRAEAEKTQADAEAEMAKYTAELAALGESTGSLTAEREHITTELSEKQLQRLADEKDIGLHEAALQGLQSRTGEADARARELQTVIEAAKAKIEATPENCRDGAHPRRQPAENCGGRADHPHRKRGPHGEGGRC